MPLPKISTPTYELELPSNGKKIKYRPFLVKEEKILIMALESEDSKQITNAIIQILNECILSRGVKVSNLATFDIEYLFLNIRSRYVGETIEVNVICPDDNETKVEVEIDIDSIKIKKDSTHKNIIKLDDTLSMKLKYPSITEFINDNFEVSDDDNSVQKSLDMIISSIDMIYNNEESWSSKDCTKKEVREFIDQLNTKQFKQIENFFTTMPKLSHVIPVKNPNTGVESEVVVEGLAGFFT